MNFDLPDHAQVLIFVGDRQALPQVGAMLGAPAPQDETPTSRGGRPKLKMLGVAALAILAFVYGQHQGLHRASLGVADSAGASTGSGQAYTTLSPAPPGRPASATSPSPGASNEVPPAFAQQLQQPPVVTPPPGTAPAGAPAGPRAFGLEE